MTWLKNKFSKEPKGKSITQVNNSALNKFNISHGEAAIYAVRDKYGIDMAKIVERMFRHETAHFTSGQYVKTGTPGLVVGKWPKPVPTSPTVNFNVNPKLEAGGRSNLDFVVWNPKDCALFLAEYIKKYDGNFARWFSTNAQKQAVYRSKVNAIKTRFV